MPTAPQFEWPQGEPLFETQWRAVTESLAGNGVVSAGDLALSPGTANREIDYAAGTVYYVATEYAETAGSVTVSVGDATYDRWDTIAYDTATPGVEVKEGTPAANPEPPDVSGGEILLGIVKVPANFDDVLTASQVLNWQGRVSNEAEEVHYDDSPGVYGVNNVDAALDELQEAAQATAYPFALGTDTDMDAGGTDLVDGATVIWDTSAGAVPQAQLGGPASSLSAYPLALGTDTDMDAGGTDLVDGATVIWDTSAGAVPQGQLGGPPSSLSAYPLIIGTDVAAHLAGNDLLDAAGGNTVYDNTADEVPRPRIDTTRIATTVSANYTTSGEEVIEADVSGGALTVTLASADAESGNVIHIVDHTGNAGTNTITVDTEGAETIEGSSSTTISTAFGTLALESDGTNWTVVAITPASGSGTDTRTDVSDDGTTVVTETSDINFASNLTVTDDGDNSVTVDATGGSGTSWTRTDVTTTSTTASPWDSAWVDTGTAGGAVTVTLPADGDTADGDRVEVGVEDATSGTDVVANTGQSIIGSNPTLTQVGDTVTMEYKASTSTWMVR